MRRSACVLLLLLPFAGATGQSRADAERRLDAIRAQIRSVEREVQQTRGEETSGIRALEEFDREIILRERLISQYRSAVDSTRAETETLRGSITRLEGEIDAARASYRVRARHAYMHGRRNSLALILASTSINQMIVRARYLQQFAQRRRRQMERISQKTGEMKTREVAVRESMEASQRLVMERQTERRDLGEKREERSVLVENVKSKRGGLERDLQQRRTDARQMESLVGQLVAQERRRADEERQRVAEARRQEEARVAAEQEAVRVAEASRRAQIQREADAAAQRAREREVRSRPEPRRVDPATDTPPEVAANRPAAPARTAPARTAPTPRAAPARTAPAPRTAPTPRSAPAPRAAAAPPPAVDRAESVSGSFRANRGRLPWPADGTVTGSFGTRTDPVYGTTINSIGIDISTVAAAPARSVFQGTVERVGTMATYGTFVMVSHGDFTTIYGNLSAVSVARGQAVTAGQVIGRAGTSENRRGSQLFFALFQGGSPSNPIGWLR